MDNKPRRINDIIYNEEIDDDTVIGCCLNGVFEKLNGDDILDTLTEMISCFKRFIIDQSSNKIIRTKIVWIVETWENFIKECDNNDNDNNNDDDDNDPDFFNPCSAKCLEIFVNFIENIHGKNMDTQEIFMMCFYRAFWETFYEPKIFYKDSHYAILEASGRNSWEVFLSSLINKDYILIL